MASYYPITNVFPGEQSMAIDAGRYYLGVYQRNDKLIKATAPHPAESVTPRSYDAEEKVSFRTNQGSNDSWTKIKKSGRIRMTDHHAFSKHVKNHVASVPMRSFAHDYFHNARCSSNKDRYGSCREVGPFSVTAYSLWNENGPLSYWKEKFPTAPHVTARSVRPSNEIMRLKTDAWSSVLNGYSLGAEIGELRETLEFFQTTLSAARHPLKAFRDARERLLKKHSTYRGVKNAKDITLEIGNLWMQYRYAIMPLIYSINDVKKLLESSPEYITERRSIDHPVEVDETPTDCDVFFYDLFTISSKTSVTVKGRFGEVPSSLDRVDINLLTTAWELIPFSFVVDWFVNIGDWVTAQAKTLTSTADVIGCEATKEKITKQTFLHLVTDDTYNFVSPGVTGGACEQIPAPFFSRPDYYKSFGGRKTYDLLLSEETSSTYDRKVFTNDDLDLTFAPFLNWKRYIDASVISLNLINTALRRLK